MAGPIRGVANDTRPSGVEDLEVTVQAVGSNRNALDVLSVNQLIPEVYDYIGLSYTGSNLTTVTYKTGGAAGTTVATLTLAYTGSQLDSITKS